MISEVKFFKLQNDAIKVVLSNYGASIISIYLKDKNGIWIDVIVGPETIEQQTLPTAKYYGSTIGRFANRIANGKFILNNTNYTLATNNGSNHLHGGTQGWDSKIWNLKNETTSEIGFNYFSPDGDEGFPGNITCTVTYILLATGLEINYAATTDADTILNITNHSYFNLNGQVDILKHKLQINANQYLPINNTGIPFGKAENVLNTPFNFEKEKTIGQNINDNEEQLKNGTGYDHSFILNSTNENELTLAAIATGDISGIQLKVYTTQPSVHLYTGNFMAGENVFKQNQPDNCRTAFCLEAQHFPNSPNEINFPTTMLKKDAIFRATIKYKF